MHTILPYKSPYDTGVINENNLLSILRLDILHKKALLASCPMTTFSFAKGKKEKKLGSTE